MSRLRGFVVCWLMIAQGSFAWAGPIPDEDQKPITPLPPSTRSEFNRQSQEMGLWAGFGFRAADLFFIDGGAEFAYFSQPNELVSFRFSRLSASESDYDFISDAEGYYTQTRHLEMTGNTYSVNWKSFLSNSFYIKLGLEQFNVRGEYYESRSDAAHLQLGDLSRQNALFSIGNQWQWKAFTMGCDWGGVTYPLAHRYKSYHDEIESTMTNKLVKFGDKTLVNFLYFYIGASF